MCATKAPSRLHDVIAIIICLALEPKIRNTQTAISSTLLRFLELVGIGDIWPETLGTREACLNDEGIDHLRGDFLGAVGV